MYCSFARHFTVFLSIPNTFIHVSNKTIENESKGHEKVFYSHMPSQAKNKEN